MQPDSPQPGSTPASPHLIRGIGLGSATALNMIDMIGVGPFITIPLIVSAMGGPQAMLGWILGAIFAMCDGLVWAELGAALPGSGGSYRYLRESFGPDRLGRLISFLFVWQLSFSAPLIIASGSIGLAGYASYFWPSLEKQSITRHWSVPLPLLGELQLNWLVSGATFVAIGVVVLATVVLYRKITSIGWISKLLLVGVIGTMFWIIVAGLSHFDASRAFSFPPGAFTLSRNFFLGLGSAMLVATYDYWGYYNVAFLGDEVKEPGKTIPRAILLSILLVSCLYVVMNVEHSGSGAVAGDPGKSRQPGLVCCVYFHAEDLRALGCQSRDRAGDVDGVRFGCCGDAGILAGALRGRPRWKLFQGVCARTHRGAVPVCVAARAGHGCRAVLFSVASGCNRRPRGYPYHAPIPGAGDWLDCVARPPS